MDGIIVIRKEKDFTSFDVVAKLRGILHQKKIGHTGTLDPDATGVLPVCLGRATKVCDLLTDTDKCYEAVMRLGVTTDTQDMSGSILSECPVQVNCEQVEEAIMSFLGAYDQVPPMYSALKINGQKLCDLARAGQEVERQPRRVEILDIEILSMELPIITMRVTCTKGTYIRTLCHDIGQKLGCGAAMEELVRVRAAGFGLEEAITLGQVEQLRDEERLSEVLIPLERVFEELPRLVMKPEYDKALANGNKLKRTWGEPSAPISNETAVYFSDGRFAAVYEWREDLEAWKPKKMFLP